jgi:hypothetical protein
MSERTPTVGRIVHYTLTSSDVRHVISARTARSAVGLPVEGYNPNVGDILPLVITRVTDDATFISGHVLLDSNDVLWVFAIRPSDVAVQAQGCWHWPEIVGKHSKWWASVSDEALLEAGSGEQA